LHAATLGEQNATEEQPPRYTRLADLVPIGRKTEDAQMAKLGEGISDPMMEHLFAKVARIGRSGTARTAARQHDAPPELLDAESWHPIDRWMCAEAWKAMAAYKKIRWWLCHIRHGDPARELDRKRQGSGFALFVREWRTQHPRTSLLPISPCSRRRTDPNASFWDYTP